MTLLEMYILPGDELDSKLFSCAIIEQPQCNYSKNIHYFGFIIVRKWRCCKQDVFFPCETPKGQTNASIHFMAMTSISLTVLLSA